MGRFGFGVGWVAAVFHIKQPRIMAIRSWLLLEGALHAQIDIILSETPQMLVFFVGPFLHYCNGSRSLSLDWRLT